MMGNGNRTSGEQLASVASCPCSSIRDESSRICGTDATHANQQTPEATENPSGTDDASSSDNAMNPVVWRGVGLASGHNEKHDPNRCVQQEDAYGKRGIIEST